MPTPEELRAKQKHLAELLRNAKKLAKAPDPNATSQCRGLPGARGSVEKIFPLDGPCPLA